MIKIFNVIRSNLKIILLNSLYLTIISSKFKVKQLILNQLQKF